MKMSKDWAFCLANQDVFIHNFIRAGTSKHGFLLYVYIGKFNFYESNELNDGTRFKIEAPGGIKTELKLSELEGFQ